MIQAKTKEKRTYDNDPLPSELAEYFADAVTEIREELERTLNPNSKTWLEDYNKLNNQITLGEIRRRLVVIMAAKNEAFSSAYRHEVSPWHSFFYRVLGSTVGLNGLIWDRQREGRT